MENMKERWGVKARVGIKAIYIYRWAESPDVHCHSLWKILQGGRNDTVAGDLRTEGNKCEPCR